ncbi:MAG: hypothetical protein WCP39_07450, partial [Chlamydiota bacterium]
MQKKALSYIEQARNLLYSIQEQPQSDEEREKLSLELASLILQAAQNLLPLSEGVRAAKLTKFLVNPESRAFILGLIDLSFRSSSEEKTAETILHLLEQTGLPSIFTKLRRLNLL